MTNTFTFCLFIITLYLYEHFQHAAGFALRSTCIHVDDMMQFLQDYCKKEQVDVFVVGEPKHMDNTPSQSARIIEPFVQRLAAAFPDKEIARIDERFTSKMAFQAMIDGGLKKKQRQDKAMVDQVSATIMLQDYLRIKN